MNGLEVLKEYLVFFIPLIILQFILAITAFVHVLKNPKYRWGNKAMWIIIVLFIQIIGPIIYFTFGKGED